MKSATKMSTNGHSFVIELTCGANSKRGYISSIEYWHNCNIFYYIDLIADHSLALGLSDALKQGEKIFPRNQTDLLSVKIRQRCHCYLKFRTLEKAKLNKSENSAPLHLVFDHIFMFIWWHVTVAPITWYILIEIFLLKGMKAPSPSFHHLSVFCSSLNHYSLLPFG